MNDSQFPPRPTALAQDFLRPWIADGDVVVDATAGNGYDTLFLARCVGENGRVYAFDVQAAAIKAAKELLNGEGMAERVEWIHGSHVTVANYLTERSASAVMFNLGYLPGENHDLTTEAAGTLETLEAAARILKKGGVLTVICYPGHEAGAMEALAVDEWLTAKTKEGWRVARYGAVGTRRPAPFLLAARVIHRDE